MIEAEVERHVIAAINAARELYNDSPFHEWADNFMSGRDRTFESAAATHDAIQRALGNNVHEVLDRLFDQQVERLRKGMRPDLTDQRVQAELEKSSGPVTDLFENPAHVASYAALSAALAVTFGGSLAIRCANITCVHAAIVRGDTDWRRRLPSVCAE